MYRTLRALILVAAATSAPLAAQQWEVTPFAGAVFPMKNLVVDTAGGGYFTNRGQTVFGLALGREFSPGVELALVGGAGKGSFEALSGGDILETGTTLWFADLRGRVALVRSGDTQFGIIAGAGYTRYSSGLFQAAEEIDPDTRWKGTFTGLGGLGVKTRIAQRIRLTLDVMDRIHAHGIEASGLGSLVEKTQHDIMVSAGLSVPLGG